MNFRSCFLVFAALLFCPTLPASEPVHLFDGATIDGWIQRGGKAVYRVENGEIIGVSTKGEPNSFLCTSRDYADFILELEVKVDANLNSGIQFRSLSKPDYQNGRVHGYQFELDPSDRGWTGGIFDEGRKGWLADLSHNDAARFSFKPGDWNAVRIEAVGNRLRTFVNGIPAADLIDDTTASGFIALQVHSVPDPYVGKEVRFRNIRIEENPTTHSPEREKISPPNSILPENLEVRRLADGFKFTEGPALGPDGTLFFADIPNETIHRFDPATQKTTVHRTETGKANGLMFTPAGALLACEGGARRVTRLGQNGTLDVVTDTFEGKVYNAPNDLDIDGRGGIYFSDPGYGRKPEEMPLGVEGVYYVSPGRERGKPAKVVRVIDDLVRPNGVLVSNDKKTLYVVDNGRNQLWAYPIRNGGNVGKGEMLCVFDPNEMKGGDGLTSDEFGNLYVAANGIYVIDPKGQLIGVIPVPERPANCVFGPRGSKTLYITAKAGFYAVKLDVDGRR